MKPRAAWKQPKRNAWLARGTKPIPKVNVAATARRQKKYKKALGSAHWKKLRAQVFAEQGGVCALCGEEPTTILDHLTYARLGHELREDVRGLGDRCNAIETTSKRANWAQPRRRA
jgi:5-methylcytosine-specific restriction endonuclease McrA